MTRANFMSGYRCPTCKAINQGNRCRYSLEFVQNYFRENGCEPLFTEYRSSSQKLKYRCVCGNITEISFAHFRSGQRCRKCFWMRRFPTGTVVASYQQRYLHRLLGGEMNYSIDWSFLDIAYPERKVYIEYDGSGHN